MSRLDDKQMEDDNVSPHSWTWRIYRFARRPFVRNVAAVASGTAISQAVALLFAPLVTRIYGPHAFGIQSVFVTVAGVMASAAAMSYPMAIVLPRRDADALGIVRLSIFVSAAVSLVVAIVLFFLGDELLILLNASEIADYRLLIPVFMLTSATGAIVSQWLIRKHEFALTARLSVVLSFLTGTIKAGIGLIQPSAISLIGANMLGGLSGTALMAVAARRRYATKACADGLCDDQAPETLPKLAYRYRDFPFYRTPQNLLNAVSTGLPIALMATYFGSSAAGFYALASAVLVLPASLIGTSLMQVFYPRVTEALYAGENAKSLVLKATGGLALTGAIPFIIVAAAGPSLFGLAFGSEWRDSGSYAQLLSPWLFLQYINKPAVSAIPALRLQRWLLVYEAFSTSSKLLALYMGFSLFRSDIAAIGLYSAIGSAAYIWLILWVISRCGKKISDD